MSKKTQAEKLAQDRALVKRCSDDMAAIPESDPMRGMKASGLHKIMTQAQWRIDNSYPELNPSPSEKEEVTTEEIATEQENETADDAVEAPQTYTPGPRPHADDGFSCELNYLTSMAKLNNMENKDTVWNTLNGSGDFKDGEVIYSDKQIKNTVVTNFKGSKDGKLVNYYKEKVYDNLPSSANPYLNILSKFGENGYEAVNFEEADFAYLTKLGVYPLNRLWVLRRFKEGDTVPDNLLDWGKNIKAPYPISTVVGWIPPEDDKFFNVSFSESWTTTTDRVDEVLMKMLDKEFKFKVASVAAIPGWSQGLMIGFLKKMGLKTGFDEKNIPMGNPNVLNEAATRLADPSSQGQGLNSSVGMTLKTSYEQKYIGDVDPGSAMLDIIRNLTKMGSSDQLFFAGADNEIFNDIRAASQIGNSSDLWISVIKKLINAFLDAVVSLFTDALKATGLISDDLVTPTKLTETQKEEKAKEDAKKTGEDLLKEQQGVIEKSIAVLKAGIDIILGSTAAKWKWPLKGGMGVMTGENTTPWHLTIGNPTSPFVSLGNILVADVNLDFKNELGFNDIPTRLEVDIKIKQGRNLGAQEVFAMFNNGYKRAYDNKDKGGQVSIGGYYKAKAKDTNGTKK